jgi:hypothetical protein
MAPSVVAVVASGVPFDDEGASSVDERSDAEGASRSPSESGSAGEDDGITPALR